MKILDYMFLQKLIWTKSSDNFNYIIFFFFISMIENLYEKKILQCGTELKVLQLERTQNNSGLNLLKYWGPKNNVF